MIRCGLVLAAGRSTRFGTANKLLASFQGRPLAAHAAKAMRGVPLDRRIAVVADPTVAAVLDGFEVLAVDGSDAPQSASLALGARHAMKMGATRLLIALADMPRVDAALMGAVLDRCTDGDAAAAADGNRAMPPACFSGKRLAALTRLSGDRGAAALLSNLPRHRLVAAPPGMLADVDTVADLERMSTAAD